MYFDSHCHLDMEPLAGEQQQAIERAFRAQVDGIINVGATLRGSEHSVAIANANPNIWASVGIHPHDAETILDFEGTMEELKSLAQKEKVVAIGEIGLDFFDQETGGRETISGQNKKAQEKLFLAQLDLAQELNKPVIIHLRDAWDETLQILNGYDLKGVIHCYTGNSENAQKLIKMGYSLGFTGFVTFEQAKFEEIREAVRTTPLERILVETDAPFLAPEPHRGKANEPAFVVEVVKKIAELKGVSAEEVAQKTQDNAKKLFLID